MTNADLLSARGNPEFAGKYCQHPVTRTGGTCTAFARYEIINPTTDEAYISCGAHMTEYVRLTWVRSGQAAIVKEVPGAWRYHV